MNSTDLLEALLFASEKPVPLQKLAQAAELSLEEVEVALESLRREKEFVGALRLVEVAGGYSFATKPRFAAAIRRLRDEKRPKLSRAAFEVLAVVAYRQPATRGDIEQLRGVESGATLNLLLERKLVMPAGRRDTPGRPFEFKTSPQFLEAFGLNSIDDLPDLEEFAAMGESAPVTMNLFDRERNRDGIRFSEPTEQTIPETEPKSSPPLPDDEAATTSA
ncbi:segregation and condensation protein B [Abditibacteriota bacterium]|nr:segregation and condensation protein B [Abditibacteriota bacterium]